MTKEELKPIDVSKYTVTENGNVIKDKLKQEAEEEKSIKQEDDKIIEWEHNPSLANNLMREDLL